MLVLISIIIGVVVIALSCFAIKRAARSTFNGELKTLETIDNTLKLHNERANQCFLSHRKILAKVNTKKTL